MASGSILNRNRFAISERPSAPHLETFFYRQTSTQQAAPAV